MTPEKMYVFEIKILKGADEVEESVSKIQNSPNKRTEFEYEIKDDTLIIKTKNYDDGLRFARWLVYGSRECSDKLDEKYKYVP